MYEPETRPIWTDTQDKVWSDITQRYHTSNHATIWRWRRAFQHDFAARIDWSNTADYDKANHPPVAKLGQPNEITVKSGETITLSASGSSDPDNDNISFNWIYYREVGTMNADQIDMKNPDKMEMTFIAPKTDIAGTMHFILEVTDDGEPSLTRYQRVIVNVIAK